MAKTRIFDKKFLRDELDLPWTCKEEWITHTSRWSIHYEGVFEYEGKHYLVEWSVGATESQDERPWQYDTTVVATEVEKRPVTLERWVEV